MMLRRQLPAYSPLSGAAIRRAAASGFAPGSNGQAGFRAELEREYSADRALLLASGTQALQVALELAIAKMGDSRVALPAFSCFDVASAAVGARARLAFYDIEPETLSPDLESLRAAFRRGYRIAVVSPLYGFPVDWDAVEDLAAESGGLAIEDAAQAGQAEWRGRLVGSCGAMSVLSFGRGKGWTGGKGGALLTRAHARWSDWHDTVGRVFPPRPGRAAEAHVVALLAAQWALARPAWYAIPHAIPWLKLGETVYRDPTPPRPMTRAASACLAASRVRAALEAAARREAAGAFLAGLPAGRPTRAIRPIRPLADAVPGYLRLPLRLSAGTAGFADPLAAARLGLAHSYPSVLPDIPQVRPWMDDATRSWPGADELVRTLVTLPTHSLVSGRERAQLLTLLRAYAAGA